MNKYTNMSKINNYIKKVYYFLHFIFYYSLELIFPSKIKNYKNIPIIINNFNRLDYLKRLIASLEKKGYTNIYILDNVSTYPPLLAYYKTCPYKIFYLKKNYGYLALWKSEVFKKFKKDFYVYTDVDVVPIEERPDDFMNIFLKALKKHKSARKVGFSLRIDNLPDHYKFKSKVIDWEKQFYKDKEDSLLYRAQIDTTFALYRPRAKRGTNKNIPMFRTAYPYSAEHLPWYQNSNIISEEEKFYINNLKAPTMWSEKDKQVLLA